MLFYLFEELIVIEIMGNDFRIQLEEGLQEVGKEVAGVNCLGDLDGTLWLVGYTGLAPTVSLSLNGYMGRLKSHHRLQKVCHHQRVINDAAKGALSLPVKVDIELGNGPDELSQWSAQLVDIFAEVGCHQNRIGDIEGIEISRRQVRLVEEKLGRMGITPEIIFADWGTVALNRVDAAHDPDFLEAA